MTKLGEQREARRLRQELGMPMKQIAVALGVSPGSVHLWTRDIDITPEQAARNLQRSRAAFGRLWSEINRERRRAYQREGRARARRREPLHLAGCMLYLAEGSKDRNTVCLSNSDMHLVSFFCSFVRTCFDLPSEDFRVRLNVYLNNGRSLLEIENRWLDALELPRSCLRGHTLNHTPTSSSGQKRDKLPYGTASVRLARSTRIVQHIFGASRSTPASTSLAGLTAITRPW